MNWKAVLQESIQKDLVQIKKDDKERAFREQYSQADLEDMFDEMLDEEGEIHIGSLTYSKSWALKQLDPTAYRIGVNELEDSLMEDFEDE
tara:strand:- start:16066 stop:16335 length:270 start_codon:yes stop_codon:yes gene_type:complete